MPIDAVSKELVEQILKKFREHSPPTPIANPSLGAFWPQGNYGQAVGIPDA